MKVPVRSLGVARVGKIIQPLGFTIRSAGFDSIELHAMGDQKGGVDHDQDISNELDNPPTNESDRDQGDSSPGLQPASGEREDDLDISS